MSTKRGFGSAFQVPGQWPDDEDQIPVRCDTTSNTIGKWSATRTMANLVAMPARLARHFFQQNTMLAMPVATVNDDGSTSIKKRIIDMDITQENFSSSHTVRASVRAAFRCHGKGAQRAPHPSPSPSPAPRRHHPQLLDNVNAASPTTVHNVTKATHDTDMDFSFGNSWTEAPPIQTPSVVNQTTSVVNQTPGVVNQTPGVVSEADRLAIKTDSFVPLTRTIIPIRILRRKTQTIIPPRGLKRQPARENLSEIFHKPYHSDDKKIDEEGQISAQLRHELEAEEAKAKAAEAEAIAKAAEEEAKIKAAEAEAKIKAAEAEALAKAAEAEAEAKAAETNNIYKGLFMPVTEEQMGNILGLAKATDNGNIPADIISGKISVADFKTLLPQYFGGDPRAWLNDNIVNEYLAKLINHIKWVRGIPTHRGGGRTPPVHAFSSFWYSSMLRNPESVKRWASRFALGGKRFLDVGLVLFPICDGGHWRLLAVKPKERTIEVFDSLSTPTKPYIDVFKRYMEQELGELWIPEEWTIVEEQRSKQQINGSDCGVFTVMNALALLKEEEPDLVEVSNGMMQARCRIASTFIEKQQTGEFEY